MASFIPPGVTVIAIVMCLVAGASAWMKWLKMLRRSQFQDARDIHEIAEDFSFMIQHELVERELDLHPEDRQDLQTRMLRFDQGLPVVMACVGALLGVFA